MDAEQFQEKMDPAHRAYFCRMLNMKNLPEILLDQYVQAKMLVDRIDARLSPGNLAMIAIIAGFDPETGKFCVTEQPVEKLRAQPLDEAVDKVVEETLEQPVDEGQLSGVTRQAQEQATAQPDNIYKPSIDTNGITEFDLEGAKTTPDKGKAMLWSPGMPVNVLQADELKQGKIVGIVQPAEGSEKAVKLTVEFEAGEIETFDENEVEAI